MTLLLVWLINWIQILELRSLVLNIFFILCLNLESKALEKKFKFELFKQILKKKKLRKFEDESVKQMDGKIFKKNGEFIEIFILIMLVDKWRKKYILDIL